MSKRVKKSAKSKTAKPKTFKTLKAAGRAIKAKAKKPAPKGKLDRNTPSKPDSVARGILVHPRRLPSQIKVGKRFRQDPGDIKSLAMSIDARGALLEPIVIDRADKLIDGERRLLAWGLSKFAGSPIPVHVVDIDSLIAGEYDANAERKSFTPSETVAIKRALVPVLAKAAKERQRQHGGTAPGRKGTAPAAGGRAADLVGKAVGKSRRTIDMAEAIVTAAEQDPARFGKLKADMDKSGRVNGPFKRLQVMQQTEALRKAPPPLPMRGPYMGVVIDFPHPAEKDAEQDSIDKRGRSMRDYPEMSIAEGRKLFKSREFQALLAPDCVVAFWTTNHHMPEAFVLLDAMGFETHSTIGTWIKNKMGRGQVLRGKTEHCVIATRGKPTINLTNQTTAWQGDGWDVREDSRKPDAFYALFEELVPAPRYAEIFSRGGRNVKWDCHGDQAGKFSPAVARAAEASVIQEAKKPAAVQKITIKFKNERIGARVCAAIEQKIASGEVEWHDDGREKNAAIARLKNGSFVNARHLGVSGPDLPVDRYIDGVHLSLKGKRADVVGYTDPTGCGFMYSTMPYAKVAKFLSAWVKSPTLPHDPEAKQRAVKRRTASKGGSVRRTLPGRDATLIAFAEGNGHVVAMTTDHATDEHVGTCACGSFEHRYKRIGKPGDASDPAIVKLRMAASRTMDGAITAHWIAMRAASDAPQPSLPGDRGATGIASAEVTSIASAPVATPENKDDDDQLAIPGFLRREPHTETLVDPKLMPDEATIKRIADRAEASAK